MVKQVNKLQKKSLKGDTLKLPVLTWERVEAIREAERIKKQDEIRKQNRRYI